MDAQLEAMSALATAAGVSYEVMASAVASLTWEQQQTLSNSLQARSTQKVKELLKK